MLIVSQPFQNFVSLKSIHVHSYWMIVSERPAVRQITWEGAVRGTGWCFSNQHLFTETKSSRCVGMPPGENLPFTLWLFNIAMENHHFFIGKPSVNGPFSMAMLNNQRVSQSGTTQGLTAQGRMEIETHQPKIDDFPWLRSGKSRPQAVGSLPPFSSYRMEPSSDVSWFINHYNPHEN